MINRNVFLGVLVFSVLIFMFLFVNFYSSNPNFDLKFEKDSPLFVKLTGYSMYPTINDGDTKSCVVKSDYSVGKIVSFQSGEELVSHRVIGQAFGKYVTKGDNNAIPDIMLVDKEKIICEVII